MKKMAICGKGGSGKSTVTALLALAIQARGYRVLVVDSDESNPGLYRILGFSKRPAPLLELVGGKKRVFSTFAGESEAQKTVLTREEIRVVDLPEDYVVERDGLLLVCIGKILQSLEGCACPMGTLAREFLKRLCLREDELALIDMEAGIEHFGRGVEGSIDSVLTITEPSFDSLELAAKINSLAAEVGVEHVWTVLNKIGSEEIDLRMREELKERGVSVIGSIVYEPEVFRSGMEGHTARHDHIETDIGAILDQML